MYRYLLALSVALILSACGAQPATQQSSEPVEQYDLLAQIAPTVAQPADKVDYGIAWDELTRTVGRIAGKQQQADELIAGVEDRFAQARAEHPEFQNASAIVATPYQGIWVYGDEDPRGRFLTSLGGPLYASMDVHTRGREVMLNSYDSTLGGAPSFVSVLSLPYLLDGDPATAVVPAKE